MSLEMAERCCDAWELEAAGRALPKDGEYWTLGAAWLAGERAARRPGRT
jgi:3'-phosphoadenosine 5'-phosphosulfate sulfotransferase (PAPS reductase)/FAD synthetase